MTRNLVIIIALLAVLGLVALLPQRGVREAMTNEITDFAKIGILSFDSPGDKQDIPYLSYKENYLAPTTTVELRLDERSVCVSRSGSTPCLAMSVLLNIPFGGRLSLIEGVERDGVISVRVMRILEEGETAFPQTGIAYISWPEATRFIEECRVDMIMQLHNLSVNLNLKDGRKLVAIEPLIDEVFKVYQRSQVRCGSIPIATE